MDSAIWLPCWHAPCLTGMHMTGCSGKTSLVLYVPGSSWARKRFVTITVMHIADELQLHATAPDEVCYELEHVWRLLLLCRLQMSYACIQLLKKVEVHYELGTVWLSLSLCRLQMSYGCMQPMKNMRCTIFWTVFNHCHWYADCR